MSEYKTYTVMSSSNSHEWEFHAVEDARAYIKEMKRFYGENEEVFGSVSFHIRVNTWETVDE